MCQYCGDPAHEPVGENDRIVIEINRPFENGEQKYYQAISTLSKAYKKPEPFSDESLSKEISPYKSVRDLENESKDRVSILLLELFDQIRHRWMGLSKAEDDDKPFKLNNRVYINPKTGKPLSKKDWKQIKKDLNRAFGAIYEQEEARIVKVAMALGKILNKSPVEKAIETEFSSFNLTSKKADGMLSMPPYYAQLQFAQQQAGEAITDLTNRSYKRIHDTIVEAQKNRTGSKQLERDLFYNFGEMNRDWRMIAETEIANNVNNGQLITEIEQQKEKDPKKPIYMKGISAPDACDWCSSQVNNQVVVLLERPPGNGTDTVTRDGKEYTAIWPGKSNVGRRRANWWVASGAQHPHCLIPGQEVTSALSSGVLEGFYEGPVIEIRTSSGRNLTVTQNHPILTQRGFVQARFLREGDYVVTSPDPEGVVKTINPDHYQRPTAIDDLFRSAKHASSMPPGAVPVSPEDFHGDGERMQGKVNVVNAYGLLGRDIETALLKHRLHYAFRRIDTGVSLAPEGPFPEESTILPGTASSILSFLGESFSRLRGSVGHSGVHGLGTIPWSQPGFDQSLSEGSAAHTQFSREFLFRFSSIISGDDLSGQFDGITRSPSSLLISDEITHINTSQYRGPVYDLTDDIYGLYIGNGIVVKNCRCTWNQHTPGFEKYDKMLDDAMAEASKEWREEHPVEQEKEEWKKRNKELYERQNFEDMKSKKKGKKQ